MIRTADQAGPTELLAAARRLMALQRTGEAIPLLNQALLLDPHSPDLRLEAGALSLRLGRIEPALGHLRACVRLAPRRADAWNQIGACHMLAGRHHEAAQAFAAAVAGEGPGSGPSWRLARALRMIGDLAAANEAMVGAARTGTREIDALHEQARLLVELGHTAQAVRIWQALGSSPRARVAGPTARASLVLVHDRPPEGPDARRVAFHVKAPFHEAILRPGWMACRGRHDLLVTHDPEEIVAFRPDIIVGSDSQLAALKQLCPWATTVQTRHGLGSKGHARLLAATCDVLCISHERQEDWLREDGQEPSCAFWPIGYLQLDPLFDGTAVPAQVPRRPDRPVVLFAPTIGDSVSALGMLGDDPVAALRPDPDAFTLVIKPHPETPERQPQAWAAMKASAVRHPGVLLVERTHDDIVPWIAAADLLVTDVSSVMFFMVALDRPIVLLSNPARHGATERFDPEGPEWRWRAVGEEVHDASEAPAAIGRALADPGSRRAARAACRAEMFGDLTDGHAGERLAARLAGLPRTASEAISTPRTEAPR